MNVDFGKVAGDYRKHRSGFPDEFFWALKRVGIGLTGQRVLDLGTGTGTVARGIAQQGAIVCGLDVAAPLLEQAAQLDRDAGVSIQYCLGAAEDLSFADATFDVVTAGQCWHWFDRPKASAQAYRVLRPGGSLVVAHFDWLPIRGTAVAATEELILSHNPHWRMAGATGFYPHWCETLTLVGFRDIESWSFDVAMAYSHERWRGRIRASAGVAASLSSDAVQVFDAELARLLTDRFPDDPMLLPHRVWTLVCRKPH